MLENNRDMSDEGDTEDDDSDRLLIMWMVILMMNTHPQPRWEWQDPSTSIAEGAQDGRSRRAEKEEE